MSDVKVKDFIDWLASQKGAQMAHRTVNYWYRKYLEEQEDAESLDGR